MGPGSPNTILMAGLECAGGKARGWSVPAFSQLMEIAPHQSWSVVQSIMAGGATWSPWVGRWTGIAASRLWGTTCYHERGKHDFMFVKNNARPHVVRDAVAFLNQHDLEVMNYPAMRPDMNLIEHVWDQISIWIRGMDRPYSNPTELHQTVRQAWWPVRGEMWGHRGRSCLVECWLFLLLEGDTRDISNRVTSVNIEPIHAPCGLVICLWICCTIMVVWTVALVAVIFFVLHGEPCLTWREGRDLESFKYCVVDIWTW